VSTDLVIHSVTPRGPRITFDLIGDATVTRSGGTGWTIIDRPHRGAAVQWLDYGPQQMTMSLMLDGISDHPKNPRSVETDCGEVSGWERPVHGDSPAVLKVAGPVPHTSLKWVLKSLTWNAAIRHRNGHRIQQALDVVLLEYVPPKVITTSSPAKAAQERQTSSSSGTSSTRRYTVKSGDTLSSIAAAKLGAAKRWPEIAKLNNIRDPNTLKVGQVLKLPPS